MSPVFISCCVMCCIVTVRALLTFSTQFKKLEEPCLLNHGLSHHFPISQTCVFNTSNLRSFPSECANGSSVRYALFISNNTNLISIDLSSLREINGGGFYQTNNPQLCLIGNLSSLVTSTSAPVCVTAQGRRDPQQCGKTSI